MIYIKSNEHNITNTQRITSSAMAEKPLQASTAFRTQADLADIWQTRQKDQSEGRWDCFNIHTDETLVVKNGLLFPVRGN